MICPKSKMECPHYIPPKKRTPKQGANPDIKVFLDFFHSLYMERFGTSPDLNGRDAITIKRLLSRWPLVSLKMHLPEYLSSDKQFYIDNGYDIPRFERYMAGQIVKKAKESQAWRVPFDSLCKDLDEFYSGREFLIIKNEIARKFVLNIGKLRTLELYKDGRDSLQKEFVEKFTE